MLSLKNINNISIEKYVGCIMRYVGFKSFWSSTNIRE